MLYETDFYAWANQQANLLRTGNFSEADIGNIAEEIESMGKREKRELVNRLRILLIHLLKWQYQPAFRGRSWEFTIREQRKRLELHLSENPSLKNAIGQSMADAYGVAVIRAEKEIGPASFPKICPYDFDEVMDNDFWPG
uniref:DUF29 domain-containing protein n=1 Tax=Candidatus Kentrum sp. TUN TaxID=2126343 RepID=A0A450ZGW4_9GAMM|nr:MAG: protein of unknown function DUF29 [Candidatus Kentron sp. TUN]VFK55275.1 MAG: protein of unknown function DUF29 [Candidatus Kentron sp. TUN]VFK55442.1 MAG: protein of unknown function DUF29 [Candidatus Kentron sp. TUN]